MKTKSILPGLFILAGALSTNAQNTSYYPDNQAIGGNWNTAVGPAALSSGILTGGQNTAAGFLSLFSNTTGFENTASGASSLYSNINGGANVAIGQKALFSNIAGNSNVALGPQALFSNLANDNVATGAGALWGNINGTDNVANGNYCLFNNNNGSNNVGMGYLALNQNYNGQNNVAIGSMALNSNNTSGAISGDENVGVGFMSLYSNTLGQRNTSSGSYALYSNQTGLENTAYGHKALYTNSTGDANCAYGAYALFNGNGADNTATGYFSLYANTGNYNTADGFQALLNNGSGSINTANGIDALYSNGTGNGNTADGAQALYNNSQGSYNTAQGVAALVSNIGNGAGNNGWFNTGLGYNADVAGPNMTNATAIGANALVNANNRVWLGDLSGLVDVWCTTALYLSDGRFKSNVTESDVKGLEFIKLLRPVVYNIETKKLTEHMTKNMPDSLRKKRLDRDFATKTAVRQTGFIAQEVEEAAKKTGFNFSGVHAPETDVDTYGLSYQLFVVPLVKAVQEQQQLIEKQNIEHLQQMQDLQKQLEEQKQLIGDLKKGGNTTGLNNINTGGSFDFKMDQNIPNPFTTETVINYSLPKSVNIAYVAIYDLSGKQLTTYPISEKGSSSITITSEKLGAGIYIYSIIADNTVIDSKRMIVTEK